MVPPLPSLTQNANATLHALTERLASHGRGLSPLLSSGFANSLASHSFAAATQAYRQPAPPPQLPVLQLVGRHQESSGSGSNSNSNSNGGGEVPVENGNTRCPEHKSWPSGGIHSDVRCGRCGEEEMEGFVWDMGVVLRREFDCWIEQCWAEAFHQLFTRAIPTLIIHLIMSGANPKFLRRNIIHGGHALDNLYQLQMLDLMYTELELRLAGFRQPEASISSGPVSKIPGIAGLTGMTAPTEPSGPVFSRDGVCFQSLGQDHGISNNNNNIEEDDHGTCLCQLTSCLGCFRVAAENRKGPISGLPWELQNSPARMSWTGNVESMEQAMIRKNGLPPLNIQKAEIPVGRGFVKNPKPLNNVLKLGQPMFPHPQMTDVLAVEEHLRWRLKEMGASDAAVEGRYGPCTNSPAALEGVELPEVSDNGDIPKKIVKVTKGRGKVRRANGTIPKKVEKGKTCYLPKEWVDEDPAVRNTAITLTFRHFLKLLHQIAVAVSPFAYPLYQDDIDELERMHPIALYRRLAEPSVTYKKSRKESRAWIECMDKWTEELGLREKNQGNRHVSENRHAEAVEYYTRAISLDPKKTIFYTNRAVALNNIGEHERAESDCRHILSRDSKNGKAFYQRAVARRGLGRLREAEMDLREVLRYQPDNETAKNFMGIVKAEVAKLPKQSAKDAMDF